MKLVLKKLPEHIIGAAIEVHRELGPGLLESAYEQCLCHELSLRNIPFERQKSLSLAYKGVILDCGYRIDLLVANAVVVEVKSVDKLIDIHQAQLLSYLRLGSWPLGLMINFNVTRLIDGVIRRVGPAVQASSVFSVPSVVDSI